MSQYRVVRVPLDNVFESPLRVQDAGQRVPSVGVLYLPNSAVGNTDIMLGQQGDAIPMYLMGQQFNITPSENTGIWINNRVAQPGALLILLIGFEVAVETTRYQ